MPFSSIQDLKASALYKRLDSLHGFSKARLGKFIEVFNSVYERVIRNKGSAEDAEAAAIPIALSSARRRATDVAIASIEEESHYFVPMMGKQLMGQVGGTIRGVEYTMDLVKNDLAFIKTAAIGNAFNWSHDSNTPIGVITDVIHLADAPEHIRVKTDKEAPFLFVASYLKDIPEEARNEAGISVEGLEIAGADGMDFIPLSFAASHTPLNGPETGITRVEAALLTTQARKDLESSDFACPKDRSFPIHDAEHVRNALSRINQPHSSACSKESMLKRIHAAAKKFGVEVAASVEANVYKDAVESIKTDTMPATETVKETAAATPAEAPKAPVDAAAALTIERDGLAAKVKELEASLKAATEATTKLAATEKELSEARAAINLHEAAKWSANLVKEGRIPMDKAEEYAAVFVEFGKEKADKIASLLPKTSLGVNEGKAATQVAKADGDALKLAIKDYVKKL